MIINDARVYQDAGRWYGRFKVNGKPKRYSLGLSKFPKDEGRDKAEAAYEDKRQELAVETEIEKRGFNNGQGWHVEGIYDIRNRFINEIQLRVDNEALADSTLVTYDNTSYLFYEFCNEQGVKTTEDITPDLVTRFTSERITYKRKSNGGDVEKAKRGTHFEIRALKPFIAFCLSQKAIPHPSPKSDYCKQAIKECKHKKKAVRTFTDAEVELLKGNESYGLYFRYAFLTGRRIGELINLRWGWVKVNKDGNSVTVLYPAEYSKIGENQKIVYPLAVVEVLEAAKARCKKLGCEVGKDDLVFPSGGGGILSKPNLDRAVSIVMEKTRSGLKRTANNARHTVCLNLLNKAKVPPKVVQRLLGHKSILTTLSYYADVDDSDTKDAITNLASLS